MILAERGVKRTHYILCRVLDGAQPAVLGARKCLESLGVSGPFGERGLERLTGGAEAVKLHAMGE